MEIQSNLVPFRDALVAGVRRGQQLRHAFSTVQRVRRECVGVDAHPVFRYVSRTSGEVVESSRVVQLVERWMVDLDMLTQLDVAVRRGEEEDSGG